MAKQQDLAKGYTCECGMEHEFPAYVYAHWREPLVHTCERCGRKHNILCGVATPVNESNHRRGSCSMEGKA